MKEAMIRIILLLISATWNVTVIYHQLYDALNHAIAPVPHLASNKCTCLLGHDDPPLKRIGGISNDFKHCVVFSDRFR